MHKLTGYILVGLEILWICGWVVLLGLGHASNETTALEYRHQITYLVFHPLTNFTILLYVLRNLSKHHELNIVMIFVFIFGIAADINTMLETILHLPQSNHLWPGMMALSISAVSISGLTIVWYFWQFQMKRGHKRRASNENNNYFFYQDE